MSLHETLRQARDSLDAETMAHLLGIEPARIACLEAGAEDPTPQELGGYARLFGLSVDAFVSGEAVRSPLRGLFLRSGAGPALHETADSGAQLLFGDFVRCVHHLDELAEQAAGRDITRLVRRSARALDGRPPYDAERTAQRLRRELALGPAQPIRSMRAVVDELGVEVFYVSPDEVGAPIDGASLVTPRPAMLVNLIGGGDCWWRTRMTLAHELCHLLLDHQSGEHDLAIFSPSGGLEARRRWLFFEGFDRIEQRANAFAAHLLAPTEGVRHVVGATDPTSESAITAVCNGFGVGRTTAIYRLDHAFGLRAAREQMLARAAAERHDRPHPDCIDRHEVGLRAGRLRALALERFTEGRIDAVRVREVLGLGLTDPLPDDPTIPAERRAPVMSATDRVLAAARAYLERDERSTNLIATSAYPVERGWRVALAECRDFMAPPEPSGTSLLIGWDLQQVRPVPA